MDNKRKDIINKYKMPDKVRNEKIKEGEHKLMELLGLNVILNSRMKVKEIKKGVRTRKRVDYTRYSPTLKYTKGYNNSN